MTELEALNLILEMNGLGHKSATSSVDGTGSSDLSRAKRFLDRSLKDILGQGWHFNTREDMELTPDGSNNITPPAGYLTIDTWGPSKHVDVLVQADGNLYDVVNNTDVFTSSLRVTYTLLLAITAVPEEVARYIALDAAMEFATATGNERTMRRIATAWRRAKGRARANESKQKDYSIYNLPEVRKASGKSVNSYSPIHTDLSVY